MEANKVSYGAKSVIVEGGAELTYCELGQEHKDVLITGAFYFHTFMPVVEKLAERYHVYAVVMRFDGKVDQLNADGTTNWARQWGIDVYRFAKQMGIEKFRYIGKCHGTLPGWYMVKEHPEMIEAFASFFLAPHVLGQTSNTWFEMAYADDMSAMMAAALRKPKSGVKKKMAEVAALGETLDISEFDEYAARPEKIWDSIDDLKETMLNVEVPIGYLFANEDPVFNDYYDSNIWAIMNTRRARTVILNGEKHLMEMDSPDRVVNEAFKFFDEAVIDYFDKDVDDTSVLPEVNTTGVPDKDFAGDWNINFKGPKGSQKLELHVALDGSNVSGTLKIMGMNQKIMEGIATDGVFDFSVAVKVAFKKGTARVRGMRNGDSISGVITLPMGDVEFEGTRA